MIGTLALPGKAAASSACGKAVLADWFDNGRVDLLYELPCYGDAIDEIPSDIRDYSDAEEVISRALQAATRGSLAPGGVDPTPGGVLRNERSRADAVSPLGSPSRFGSQVDRPATAGVDPSGASSLPIPLLILVGLSLVLLATGGLGYVSRRRREVDDAGQDESDH